MTEVSSLHFLSTNLVYSYQVQNSLITAPVKAQQ